MDTPEYTYLAHQLDGLRQEVRQIAATLEREKTLTVAQFSEATNVPKKTVIYWCANGIIRATQIGDKYQWMILKSEVDRVVSLAKDSVRDEEKSMKVIKRFHQNQRNKAA